MHPAIKAALEARKSAGLMVETTIGGQTARQAFSTVEQRDEYMARAIRCGAVVRIVS